MTANLDRSGLRLFINGSLVVVVGFLIFLLGLDRGMRWGEEKAVAELQPQIDYNAAEMSVLNDRIIGLQESMVLIGICSWYGDREAGRQTVNQEIFNPNELTAASLFLPFQSRWKVTRIDTGASVAVRINDVIPGRHGRILDLSQAAAARLGMVERGIVRVRIQPGF